MYLLDTNVVSELRKVRLDKADSGVAEWAAGVNATDLRISGEKSLGLVCATAKLPRKLALMTRRSIAQAKPLWQGRQIGLNCPCPRAVIGVSVGAGAQIVNPNCGVCHSLSACTHHP